MENIQKIKEEIEQYRKRLDQAIEKQKPPEIIQRYSEELDHLIANYLDVVEK